MRSRSLTATLPAVLVSLALASGCATQIKPPTQAPQPSAVRFKEFTPVVMSHVSIKPPADAAAANQKAAKKVDELLFTNMRMVFPDLQDAATSPAAAKSARVLTIQPSIEEVKFVGGAARFWVGAMAGSSAIKMKVTFTDNASGQVVAQPEFFRAANAFGGAMSMGASDNAMLDQIVQDICSYAKLNL